MNNNQKFIIPCPGNVVTGGAECLHQLCDALNVLGFESFIYYYSAVEKELSIPADYQHYNIKKINFINDSDEIVLVLHEAVFNYILNFKKTKFIFWWLSVDNLYTSSRKYLSLVDYFKLNPYSFLRVLASRSYFFIKEQKNYFKNNVSIQDLSKMKVINLYQSSYAKSFLTENNFSNIYPLLDYINLDFKYEVNQDKKDIIAFNPKKGYAFTKKIISRAPHFNWIPLINLNRSQVKDVLRNAKVYIDFGNHPGRDKIPREAAMSGCCIITGRKGSANFYEDVAIKDEYKIDDNTKNVSMIIKKIEDIFENYNDRIQDFEHYREEIQNGKAIFLSNINNFLKVLNKIN